MTSLRPTAPVTTDDGMVDVVRSSAAVQSPAASNDDDDDEGRQTRPLDQLTSMPWMSLSLSESLNRLTLATSSAFINDTLPRDFERASKLLGYIANLLHAVRHSLVATGQDRRLDQTQTQLVQALTRLKAHLEHTGGVSSEIPQDDPYRTLFGSLLLEPLVKLVVRHSNDQVPVQVQTTEVERKVPLIVQHLTLDIVRDLISHNLPNKRCIRNLISPGAIGSVLCQAFDYHISFALLEIAYRVCPAARYNEADDPKTMFVREMFAPTKFGDNAREYQTLFQNLKSGTFFEKGPELLLLIAHSNIAKSQWFPIIDLTYNGRPLKTEQVDDDLILWFGADCLSATLPMAIQEDSQELFDERLVVPLGSIKKVDLLEAPPQSQGRLVMDFILSEPPFLGITTLDEPATDAQGSVLHFVTTNSGTSLELLRKTLQHRSKTFPNLFPSLISSGVVSSGIISQSPKANINPVSSGFRKLSQSEPLNASRPTENANFGIDPSLLTIRSELRESQVGDLGTQTPSIVTVKRRQAVLKLADIPEVEAAAGVTDGAKDGEGVGEATTEYPKTSQEAVPIVVESTSKAVKRVPAGDQAVGVVDQAAAVLEQPATRSQKVDESSIETIFKEWDDLSDLTSIADSEEDKSKKTRSRAQTKTAAPGKRRSPRLSAASDSAPAKQASTKVDEPKSKTKRKPAQSAEPVEVPVAKAHTTTKETRRTVTSKRRQAMRPAQLNNSEDLSETQSITDPPSSTVAVEATKSGRKRKLQDDAETRQHQSRGAKTHSGSVPKEVPIRVPSLTKRPHKRVKITAEPVEAPSQSIEVVEDSQERRDSPFASLELPERTLTLKAPTKVTTPPRKTYGKPKSRRKVMQTVKGKKKSQNLKTDAKIADDANESGLNREDEAQPEAGVEKQPSAMSADLERSRIGPANVQSTPKIVEFEPVAHAESSASPAQLQQIAAPTEQKESDSGELADVSSNRLVRRRKSAAPISSVVEIRAEVMDATADKLGVGRPYSPASTVEMRDASAERAVPVEFVELPEAETEHAVDTATLNSPSPGVGSDLQQPDIGVTGSGNGLRSVESDARAVEDSGYFAVEADKPMAQSKARDNTYSPPPSQPSSSQVVVYSDPRRHRRLHMSPIRTTLSRPTPPQPRSAKPKTRPSSMARPLQSKFKTTQRTSQSGLHESSDKARSTEKTKRRQSAPAKPCEEDSDLQELRRHMIAVVDHVIDNVKNRRQEYADQERRSRRRITKGILRQADVLNMHSEQIALASIISLEAVSHTKRDFQALLGRAQENRSDVKSILRAIAI
ncbi:hypothetical protein ACM66B_004362 [Microbotryomycetes sp. NB124-2]